MKPLSPAAGVLAAVLILVASRAVHAFWNWLDRRRDERGVRQVQEAGDRAREIHQGRQESDGGTG